MTTLTVTVYNREVCLQELDRELIKYYEEEALKDLPKTSLWEALDMSGVPSEDLDFVHNVLKEETIPLLSPDNLRRFDNALVTNDELRNFLTPNELTHLISVHERQNIYPQRILELLRENILAKMDEFNPQGLSYLAYAYAHFEILFPTMLNAPFCGQLIEKAIENFHKLQYFDSRRLTYLMRADAFYFQGNKTAFLSWQYPQNPPLSPIQTEITSLLHFLGFPTYKEFFYGYFPVRLSTGLIVDVDNPSDFQCDGSLSSQKKLEKATYERNGWRIFSISSSNWEKLETEDQKLRFLTSALRSYGILIAN